MMMGNALGDADTSLHNHKNCLSPRCCRHSKLFSSFYSFKNLPSFFTTLNNKDFEAIKSECVVYLRYNCERAISHNVIRLKADALIIALQKLCKGKVYHCISLQRLYNSKSHLHIYKSYHTTRCHKLKRRECFQKTFTAKSISHIYNEWQMCQMQGCV